MLFGKRKALGENVFQDKDKENCEIKVRINQAEAGQERAVEDLV